MHLRIISILVLEAIGLSAQILAFYYRWKIVYALQIDSEFRNMFYLVMGVVFMNFVPLLVTHELIMYLPLLGVTYGLFLIMVLLTPPSRKPMTGEVEETSLSLWKTSNSTRHYGYVMVSLALILSTPLAVFHENVYISHSPLMIWTGSFVIAMCIERSIWKKMSRDQPHLEDLPPPTLDGESSIIEAYGYFTFNCISQISHDVNHRVIIVIFNEVREELSFVFDSRILREDGTFSITPLLDRAGGFRNDQIAYICRSFGYLNSRLLETYSNHTTKRYALDKFNQIYEQTKQKFSLNRYLDEFICSLPDGVGDEDKIELVGQEEFQKIYRKKTTELLESQDRYRVLFYYAIDPIFTHNTRFRLLDINPSGCSLFGKKESDIVGKNILDLQGFHPEDRVLFDMNIHKIISGELTSLTDSYRFVTCNEEYKIFEITSTGLPGDSESRIITNVCRDITDRKRAEEQIKASLQEKEVLLKEVHHRVKNNMQVISSLLSLQSGYITDESMRHILKESQYRIRSMALVHEKLYQSKNFARINVKEYVRALIRDLTRSYKPDAGSIGVEVDIGDMFLGVDQAIPCGLIINELVSNSFRHAFPEGRSGHLSVSIYAEGAMVNLVVRDDGVGIPRDIDYENTESLGLRLVTLLARDQLHGNIELNRSKGTEFRITFTES